jgi:hypothetical protein
MRFQPWIALALLGTLPVWAQTNVPDPVLHRRGYHQVEEDLGYETRSSGRTQLPVEVSGEYSLGSGEVVEVELQPDRLSGFITRFGDRASDEGTPLTFFFATSRLSDRQIAFTTRQVHGKWFSFEGTIVRGPAQTRDQQGYYLLEGRLTLHDAANQTEQPRNVSLPMARQNRAG